MLHSTSMLFTYFIYINIYGQSHPSLCDPMDYNPPGSFVHGIFQARILEWVAISFLLQRSFLIQGSNPCLLHFLHWQADSLPLSHLGSPGHIYQYLCCISIFKFQKYFSFSWGITTCNKVHKFWDFCGGPVGPTGLRASNAEGECSILARGTKIPHAVQDGQKNE